MHSMQTESHLNRIRRHKLSEMAKQSSSLHKLPSQEVFCTVTRCLATSNPNHSCSFTPFLIIWRKPLPIQIWRTFGNSSPPRIWKIWISHLWMTIVVDTCYNGFIVGYLLATWCKHCLKLVRTHWEQQKSNILNPKPQKIKKKLGSIGCMTQFLIGWA